MGEEWTRAGRPEGPHDPHPRCPRPYYTPDPCCSMYRRGRGGCGRGDGALVATLSGGQVTRSALLLICMYWAPALSSLRCARGQALSEAKDLVAHRARP